MTRDFLSVAELSRMKRASQIPFTVQFADTLQEISCLEIKRLLPGRRIAAIADWRGERVFAKLFFAPSARADWRAEVEGHDRLADLGVATPQLVERASAPTPSGLHVCVYQLLHNGTTMKQVVDRKLPATSELRACVAILAKCHDGGFKHADPHLDNFMLHNQTVYAVDTADVVPQRLAALTAAPRRNLARFLATLPPAVQPDIPDLIDHYLAARGQPRTEEVLRRWLTSVERRRRIAQWRYVQGKVFRNCSEFVAHRSAEEFFVFNRKDESDELHELFVSLGAGTASSSERNVRLGARTFAIIDTTPDRWSERLELFSRGRRLWSAGHLLRINGIKAPRPVALLVKRSGRWVDRSYLLVEPVGGTDLNETSELQEAASRSVTVEQVRGLIERMSNLGIQLKHPSPAAFSMSPEGPAINDLSLLRWNPLRWRRNPQAKKIDEFLKHLANGTAQ